MSDNHKPAPEYRDLTPAFFGSLTEATVLRESLAANGYESFIPSENLKVTDPFITGPNALDVNLVVPRDDAEVVAALLQELRAERESEPTVPTRRSGWIVILVMMFGLWALYWIADLLFL